MWPTWQQSAVTGLICMAIALVLTVTKRRGVAVFVELTILAALYMIWRVAGDLPLDTMKGAIRRAHREALRCRTVDIQLLQERVIRYVAPHPVRTDAELPETSRRIALRHHRRAAVHIADDECAACRVVTAVFRDAAAVGAGEGRRGRRGGRQAIPLLESRAVPPEGRPLAALL